MFNIVWVEIPVVVPNVVFFNIWLMLSLSVMCIKSMYVGLTNYRSKSLWTNSSFWYLCLVGLGFIVLWPVIIYGDIKDSIKD